MLRTNPMNTDFIFASFLILNQILNKVNIERGHSLRAGPAGTCACMALGTSWHNSQLVWLCLGKQSEVPRHHRFSQSLLFPEEMPKSHRGTKRRAARVAAAPVHSDHHLPCPICLIGMLLLEAQQPLSMVGGPPNSCLPWLTHKH